MQQPNVIECGLKREIKRQAGFKNYEAKVGDFNKMCMIKAWKAMTAAGLNDAVSAMIWEHVSNPLGHVYKYLASDLLGYETEIKDYVSKKTGKVSLAHYTVHGSYLGSVAKMGPEPVSYEGYFRINENDFVLNLDLLAGLTDFIQTGAIKVELSVDEMIAEIFTPKTNLAIARVEPKTALKKAAPKPPRIPDSDDEDVPIGQLRRK